jgi:hypothetical protein
MVWSIFEEDPASGSTITDDAAVVIARAHAPNLMRMATTSGSTWPTGANGPAFQVAGGISGVAPVNFQADASGNIYVVVAASSGAMNITGTPAGIVKLRIRAVP